MEIQKVVKSLTQATPPTGLSIALKSSWRELFLSHRTSSGGGIQGGGVVWNSYETPRYRKYLVALCHIIPLLKISNGIFQFKKLLSWQICFFLSSVLLLSIVKQPSFADSSHSHTHNSSFQFESSWWWLNWKLTASTCTSQHISYLGSFLITATWSGAMLSFLVQR